MNDIRKCYVLGSDGNYYVQVPADNQWGVVLEDEHHTWNFPPCLTWRVLAEEEVPEMVRERLSHLFEHFEDAAL